MAGSIGQPTIGILPWAGFKSSVGTPTRGNVSTFLGMGYLDNGNLQNNSISWDMWLDSGTWKVCLIGRKNVDKAITTVQLDGVSQGTVDWYNAALVDNSYNEVTGISVTTPGVKTLTLATLTRNASATDWSNLYFSIALIKTAGAHSSPAGTDTPGYTWQFLPFMGYKAASGLTSRAQDSGMLGGGTADSTTGVLDDYIEWDIWLDAGTYKFAGIFQTGSNRAIAHIKLDGTDKGTIDTYSAGVVSNVYSEVTAIVVATAGVKTFRIQAASKNGSSSAYYLRPQSVAWIRTGA